MAIHQNKPLRILVLALTLVLALYAPLHALAAILEVYNYDDLMNAAANCAADDIIMLMQDIDITYAADTAIDTVVAGNVIVTGDGDNTFIIMDGTGDPGLLLMYDGNEFTVEYLHEDGGDPNDQQKAAPAQTKPSGTAGSGNVASLYTATRRTPIYTDETKAKRIGYLAAGAKVTVRFISSGMACFGNGYVAYADLKHTP